jgi:hypothetical protein
MGPLRFRAYGGDAVRSPAFIGGGIQRIVHAFDPTVLASVRTIEENLERETSPTRLGAALALLLGGLALTLASIGIYGVTAYLVTQ